MIATDGEVLEMEERSTAQATHQRFAVPLITGDTSIEEVFERMEDDRLKAQQKLEAGP